MMLIIYDELHIHDDLYINSLGKLLLIVSVFNDIIDTDYVSPRTRQLHSCTGKEK